VINNDGNPGQPSHSQHNHSQHSHTALTAAAARAGAAHLIVDDDPLIFADILAATLLGDQADEFIDYHRNHGSHLVLATARAAAACRSRFTEDRLSAAAGRGITQYVILGAGLDSFGYRSPLAAQLRVFEVDHPASQQWKRQQLAAAGISVPATVTLVPADLESTGSTGLVSHLADAGFDLASPAVVSWLGVTMYLTRPAIEQTLGELGRLAPGSELVADYMLPEKLRDETGSSYAEQVMPIAAQRGEPWLTFLAPAGMSALLAAHGFAGVRHVSQRDQVDPALWQRTDPLRPAELSVLAHATREAG
jgi:methyltransferase (TIGR00027 family)